VAISDEQAWIVELLGPILVREPGARALFAPGGSLLTGGDTFRSPELGDAIERLGADGEAPFYTGDVAAAIADHIEGRGGLLTRADLAAYSATPREPLRVGYRGRDVLTNPPPNAGGVLLAIALGLLDRSDGPPSLEEIVDVMEAAQAERTDEFTAGLADPAFSRRFVASRLGSTTHISGDGRGRPRGVGDVHEREGSGIVVPGTGVHVNNIMGEEDLNPLGFHRSPPGTRMPSMMAPTVVLSDGDVELSVGSAGSNRIRSAILQTIVGVVDHGMPADEAIRAPRVHPENGVIYAEPGIDTRAFEAAGRTVQHFRALNVFFGGAQAVEHNLRTGETTGAGDPRRGGRAASA
jgi:gamma-glutamyltranspeptidase/glutathione hydrolase